MTNRFSTALVMLAGAMMVHGMTAACGSQAAAHAGPGGGSPGTVLTAECDAKHIASVSLPGLSVQEIVLRAHVYGSFNAPTNDLPGATSAVPIYGFADGKLIVSCFGNMSEITVILD